MAKNTQEPRRERTIRISDSDWARLESACEQRRKSTGKNSYPSTLAEEIIRIGLSQIENHGDLIVTY